MRRNQIRCHCGGRAGCQLCEGAGKYSYTPGPRGWMPFRCPTCQGAGRTADGDERCSTCCGNGSVDPADPPPNGSLDVVWKALFGA